MILLNLVFGAALSSVLMTADNTEVVVASNASPTTCFAAKEAARFLGETLGCKMPVVHEPTDGRVSIVVGANAWSSAAGLDPERLPRDGFRIKASGRRIYIVGKDDPDIDLEKTMLKGLNVDIKRERASVFGVYEFLERYAGTRFYFAGELGTVVRRLNRIEVPDCDFSSSPHFTVRHYYQRGDGPWHAVEGKGLDYGEAAEQLNWVRLRMHTYRIPCCHGQNGFDITRRFRDTHPEYLQLQKDGTRATNIYTSARGAPYKYYHLCQSKVFDQFFVDIKKYCERGSTRGIGGSAQDEYVDVMPQDAYRRCHCPDCMKAYSTADSVDYATELVWGKTVELANRLRAAKLPVVLTQMAYPPYARVPDFTIPDNVRVMVARLGPWSVGTDSLFDRDVGDIRAWNEKMGGGRSVWIWTYPEKTGLMAIRNLPHIAPRAMAKFYNAVAPHVFGAYAESMSDKAIFNYLNYYVFSRIAWNGSVDVEALLEEFHRLMFGAAASEMARFFDGLEDCWINGIYGKSGAMVMGAFGPERQPPNEIELFCRIYSPERIAQWRRLFDRALSKVGKGSLAARRIALFHDEVFAPLADEAEKFVSGISVADELDRRRRQSSRPVFECDFSTLDGWSAQGTGKVALDSSCKVLSTYSLLLSNDDGSLDGEEIRAAAKRLLSDGPEKLKPSTRYRISYFIKYENIKPLKRHAGVSLMFYDNIIRTLPGRAFTGSSGGWIHQSCEFLSRKNTNKYTKAYLLPRMVNCTGKVWFDGIRIEEIKDKRK